MKVHYTYIILWTVIGFSVAGRIPENSTEINKTETTTEKIKRDDSTTAKTTPTTDPTTTAEPVDNGMTVADVSFMTTTGNTVDAQPSTDKYYNHKNFTASPYVGAILETPPLQKFNKYQAQYREYYKQKEVYNAKKPISSASANTPQSQYAGLSAYENTNPQPQIFHPTSAQYDVTEPMQDYPEDERDTTPYSAPLKQNEPYEDDGQKQEEPRIKFPYSLEKYKIPYEDEEPVQKPEDSEFKFPDDLRHKLPFDESLLKHPFVQNLKAQHPHLPLHDLGTEHAATPNLFGTKDIEPDIQLGPEFHEGLNKLHYGHHKTVRKPDPWRKVLNVLTTLIPFGLILATLTPNFLLINSTLPNLPSRQRSLENTFQLSEDDKNDPVVKLIEKYGLESIDDPKCEDRIFCEMAVMGQQETANFIQRSFWFLAKETPDSVSDQIGMRNLFKAIRTNTCDFFNCKPKDTNKKGKVLKTS